MRVKIETITPAKAKNYLEHNVCNRKFRRKAAAALAVMLASGDDWEDNGDPIRFREDGALLDGQHRLAAVVSSGVSIQAPVVRGLSAKAFQTMDRGLPRSLADTLALEGYHHAPLTAATIKLIAAKCLPSHCINVPKLTITIPFADRHALLFLKARPRFVQHVQVVASLARDCAGWCPTSMMAALRHLYSHRLDDDQWWIDFMVGQNLKSGMGRFAVRKFFVREATQQRKMERAARMNIMISAINRELAGDTVKNIRILQQEQTIPGLRRAMVLKAMQLDPDVTPGNGSKG